ncbi:MAG TPA: TolC family protein [Gemmatimonadaceae bacterium]
MTLADALQDAQAANARLPLAALGVTFAQTQVRETQASRWPTLSLQGSASAGAPLAYTTSQGQLQVVGDEILSSGGFRRATLRAARFGVQAAGAGYRIAQKDVDLDVRLLFAEFQKAQEEIEFRVQGIDRLRSYLAQVQARRAAGQPVGSDVLTIQVRLGTEEATLTDAQRALDDARLDLNDLMGRNPRAPLAIVPLPAPSPPASEADSAWSVVPELRQAAASRAAAEALIAAARSERRPQLALSANLGVLPVFADSDAGTGLNSGSGFGGAVVLSLSWPFWDAGVFGARLERAQLQAQQARDSERLARRQARLAWQHAAAQRSHIYDEVQTWGRNVPLARDAYVQTTSMYYGGVATALEVLDAFAAWINASESYTDAVLRFREADANALRWGTP